MAVEVKRGDLVEIAEEDYQYGRGSLTLRVQGIAPPVSANRADGWVDLYGIEIGWDGERRGERRVRVRIAALSKKARP